MADSKDKCSSPPAPRRPGIREDLIEYGFIGKLESLKHETMTSIKSRQRVADHGEVFTPEWLVEAMLNLVNDETERIDSRFLEPACGSGNFLVKVLRRKLAAVERKYGKSDFDRRHYALLSLMCIYGIELLSDNIKECRANEPRRLSRRLQPERGWSLWEQQSGIRKKYGSERYG